MNRPGSDPAGPPEQEHLSCRDGTSQESWRSVRCAMIRRMTTESGASARKPSVTDAEAADYEELGGFAFTKHPDYSDLVKERSSSIVHGESAAAGHLAAGTALMILRTYRGLTQKRLAEISQINKSTISSYERGQRSLGGTNLERLLEAMELPLRAWESTLRHVRWLRWLTEDLDAPLGSWEGEPAAPTPGEVTDRSRPGPEATGDDLYREIHRIAELAGREREMKVARVLELMARFLE